MPKHVKRVRSKGKDYFYFDTGKRVDGRTVYAPLPPIRSADFGGVYAALLGHRNRRGVAESLRIPKLIDLYQRGPAFRGLAQGSRNLYDIYLRRLEKLMPTAPVAEIVRSDIRKLVDGMADTPGAANAFLAITSALFAWAVHRDYATGNPCDGITPFPVGEHQPWPEHILKAALASDDARVRLLTHLLYYTAQRLGDVLAMAWTDINADRLTVRQRKTGRALDLPLHQALRGELARHPRTGVVICAIDGRAITPIAARNVLKAFGAAMGARCVPHGLRKNAVNALLEAGCSAAETAAISGQSLGMVEHYAKARNQATLATSAVLQWERRR